MRKKTIKNLISASLALALPLGNALALPVFPGAVGFGTGTPAGRGGEIIRVTNLNKAGPGSLAECVWASGPRICVFEVSGTIDLDSTIRVENPYLTIAGQTAPAPGIMIRGASLAIATSHVLVQHIAIRPGDGLDGSNLRSRDSVKVLGTNGPAHNVVFDHCSLSWAIDENIEVWGDNWDGVTLSNNIFSEPLRNSPEEAGGAQGYGALVDAATGHVAFIGNLFAHAYNRNPRSAAEDFVFVNNVVYNAGVTQLNLFNKNGLASNNSIVGNVFIKGQDTFAPMPILLNGAGVTDVLTAILSGTSIYLEDNEAEEATLDPWSIVLNESDVPLSLLRASTPPVWPSNLDALPTEGGAVLDYVLTNAGTRPGQRNAVDARVVQDVRDGTGRIINCVSDDGSHRCRKNAGGWPSLANNTRVLDVPGNPSGDSDDDGYTNVEEWLHAFAAQVESRAGDSGDPDQPTEPTSEPSPPKPPRLTGML